MSFVVRLAGLAAAAGFAAAQSKISPGSAIPTGDLGTFGFYGLSASVSNVYIASGAVISSVSVGSSGSLASGAVAAPLVGPAGCNSTNSTRLRALQEGGASNNSSNCTGSASIGYAVSASNDGNTVVSGAAGQGAGSFFTRTARAASPSWIKLSDSQDSYLALSGDGSTAVAADGNYKTTVFSLSSTTATVVADLTTILGTHDVGKTYNLWPASMSLTTDGRTIAISARKAPSSGGRRNSVTSSSDEAILSSSSSLRPSAVVIFVRSVAGSSITYVVQSILTTPSATADAAQSMFGFSVALTGDGFGLAISEPFTSATTGTVYIGARSSLTGSFDKAGNFSGPTSSNAVIFGNSLSFGINASFAQHILAIGVLDMTTGNNGGVIIYNFDANLVSPLLSITPSTGSYCGQQVSVASDFFAFSCGFPASMSVSSKSAASSVYTRGLTCPSGQFMNMSTFACDTFSSKAAPTPSAAPGTVVVPAALVFGGVTEASFQNPQTILDLQAGILASYRNALTTGASSVSIAVNRISNADTGVAIWTSTGARRLQTTVNVRVDYSVIVASGAAAASIASAVTALTTSSTISSTVAGNVAAAATASGNTALAQTVASAVVTAAAPPSTTPAASSPSIVGPVVGGVIGGLAAIIIAVFAFRTLSAKKGDPSQFQGENPMPKRSQVVPA